METPNVDEEIKIKAYKQLIEELEQQYKEKDNIVKNLEVELFKKYLLYEVSTHYSKEDYERDVNQIKEKIKEEEDSEINLENILHDLKESVFARRYGKQQ